MTLTGLIEAARQGEIQTVLAEAYAKAQPPGPVAIDNVTVFRQESRAVPFRILQRFALSG